MNRKLFFLLVLATPLYLWRLNQPGFSDTEGMFAEPAREIVASGDWVTPHMNGEPFLTKPPLMYWLPATMFTLFGPTEYARLWSVLAALATVYLTGLLGRELYGETAGLIAATILSTSLGFLLEARMLRTDMMLVLTVTLALYCYTRLRRDATLLWAAAFWATLGIGLLDKGFVPLLLAGATIAALEIINGELRPHTVIARLQALSAARGVLLLAALVVPWHLFAGARNPGFLWDYVVNQHLLFFFDKKLPRDSIPDSLGFFWGSFLVRSLPWSLLLPGALLHAWSHARTPARSDPTCVLPLVWLLTVLGFFSLAVSRLEHYALPALPAMALLVGALVADGATGPVSVYRSILAGPAVVVGLLAILITFYDPSAFLSELDTTLDGYNLEPLVRPALLALAVGALGLVCLLLKRWYWAGYGLAVLSVVGLFPFVQIARERTEPLFSWRPFAHQIRDQVPVDGRVFFRAEDEYQLCGGLNYYLARRIDLLAPPQWTPPTFLRGHTHSLFTPREELVRQWQAGQGVLVADAVATQSDEAQLAPGPFRLLARAGERVLLRPDLSQSTALYTHDLIAATSVRKNNE
jgi:4-amino-4-deoxy-L-arabinose transferase-like glycosyltransferase